MYEAEDEQSERSERHDGCFDEVEETNIVNFETAPMVREDPRNVDSAHKRPGSVMRQNSRHAIRFFVEMPLDSGIVFSISHHL